jgi:MFS family permease
MRKTSSADLSPLYGWFALALLFVVALFNYLDRTILSIMQVALKRELGLSDTQLGTLTGLSFALFYTTLALPVARLADRASRKRVLAAALTVWTLMTAASSLATGYFTLLACRVGVAVGEAGCVPTTMSLISDYFPRHRRALAMAVWGLALPLGGMLGFAVGGELTAAVGWRHTFLIVGLSGLLMTPVVLLFLKEPRRGRFDGTEGGAVTQGAGSFGRSVLFLWNIRSFRYLVIGEALQAWAQNGMMVWNAPFYSRLHHMRLAEIATWLALITGFGGAAGTFLGGALAERLAKGDVRWYMRVPAIAAFLTIPFALAQYLVADPHLSLVLAIVPAVMVNVYMAPGNAVSQSLVPAEMRAFTAAVFVLVVSLVGGGCGPTSIGILSDLLIHRFGLGEASLRFALPTVVIPALAAAILFHRSSVYLPAELTPLHNAQAEAEELRVADAAVG